LQTVAYICGHVKVEQDEVGPQQWNGPDGLLA